MKSSLKILFIISTLFALPSFACSTFFINSGGQMVFGRNYDWVSDAGMVCTNLKGLFKTSLKEKDGNTTNWVSKYGSITFNQYGKEFPTGGMNEAGLVVELMWAEGTQYPDEDSRPAIGVLQWIQYQLDNHVSIDEVIRSDKFIRISKNNPPLHYLIADASGHVATIEFFDGKLVAHQGDKLPFPVLTNNPYKESAKVANEAKRYGDTSYAFLDNSLQRFTKACSMVQEYKLGSIKKPAIDFAFSILDKVSQPGFTVWSIVYDLKNKQIHFKTREHSNIKIIKFNAFDFDCDAGGMAMDMNLSLKGNISKKLTTFSDELNRKILQQAIKESKKRISISDPSREMQLDYPKNIKCK